MSAGNPSSPGAFMSCIWNKVSFISSRDGILLRIVLSSSDMQLGIRFSSYSGNATSTPVNIFLKEEYNNFLIWFELVTHWPSFDLIASMLICLLLMMVERWKNFVFLSRTFNHNSLDSCFYRISLLINHSNNSNCSVSSIMPFSSEGVFLWTSLMFLMRRLTLS